MFLYPSDLPPRTPLWLRAPASAFSLCLLLDLLLISRVIPRRPQYSQVFLKPLVAAVAMGAAAWAVYGLAIKVRRPPREGERPW